MIDIIIPLYNGEKYINDLLDCFARQRVYNFRLIFVNDGSIDKSSTILDMRKKDYDFEIVVINKKNGGVASARNTGILFSTAEYITFVDVDDFVTENYSEFLEEAKKKDVDLLLFQSIRVKDYDSSKYEYKKNKKYIIENVETDKIIDEFIVNPTRYGVYNLLFKREKFQNILFEQNLVYYEDYEYLYKMFASQKTIYFSYEEVYLYLQRFGSAMNKFNEERIYSLKKIEVLLEGLKNKFQENIYNKIEKWTISRLYWSVLWQSIFALNNYSEFKKFYQRTNGKNYLKKLIDVPFFKVKLTSILCLFSPKIYYYLVSIFCKKRTKIVKSKK
ncbi:glycosyltransferase family 2 protein [Fusobacterium periodonticum]|uniref:Glycosyltransferase 2-like domain-containing protein n=1 Tax=Fusobacterium periodonticum D10 TaxID=620833 RepID=K1GJI3_9FUSO|nr:glycosyltransferase [Fusobacterium periodonticum]EKA93515.1 hypothetical protein FPOG_00230 [Fusobacterium periodonticum D10]